MLKKPPAGKRSAPLEAYRAKRNFSTTPEPGREVPRGKAGRPPVFVVQEHHARAHHFDFRLEMDGVLASWAVPKGVPSETGVNRLAVHVEDHPLDYAVFEGTIPKGNYGAGEVRIWDNGHWTPLDKDWRSAYRKGKLKFSLAGKNLHGPYLLVRTREEKNWILRKLEPDSEEPPATPPLREPPRFIEPQLARIVSSVPSGKEWLHELKLDGYRLIAVRKGKAVRLHTRTGLDWTDRFRSLADELRKIPGGDFVLDGEAVVLDAKGRSRFGLLQEALKSPAGKEILLVAFDLLNHRGETLLSLPLSERLRRLAEFIPEDTGRIRRSKTWHGPEGPSLFRQACRLGLEGIISKKAAGRYHSGDRRDWVKSKCRARQEFVICGFTRPNGSCPAFGALVLGSFENGRLVPRGKVGTGFSDAGRRSLLKTMKPLSVAAAPFAFPGGGITWLEPKLVAEIEFSELTAEGAIRQGSFLSLREDKPPGEVHLDPIQISSPGDKDPLIMKIAITHPDRVVYPDDGITKLEVARWFERVGPLMLPYVKDRPLAILRAPEGLGGETFFQKSFKNHVPDRVLPAKLADGTEVFSVRDVEGIISLAQFGMLEIHPWGSTLAKPDKPDQLVWDLDPDAAVPWKEVLGAAFLLRDFLIERDLEPVVKTSGGKGLHVILPLRRVHGWDVMKPFSKAVASAVAALNPRRFVVESSLAKRKGKIYIDWLRNGRGATCIAPWCLRARKSAPVSMPLDWNDLAGLPREGFGIHDPLPPALEWKNARPQQITKAHLGELLP